MQHLPHIPLYNKNFLDHTDIQVYPNLFTLDMEGMNGKKKIKLYDCQGQLLLDKKTIENAVTLAPAISEIVYFETILNGDKMSAGRVVKLK